MQHRSSEGRNVRAAGGRWFSIRGLVVGSILGGFRILSLRVYLFYWLNSTTHKNRPKNQLPIYCSLFYAFTFGDCVGTWNSRNRYQSSLTQGNRPKNYYVQKSGWVHASIERSPQQVIIEGRCGHLDSIWSLFLVTHKWQTKVIDIGGHSVPNRQNTVPLHLVKWRYRVLKFLVHFSSFLLTNVPQK